MRSNVAQLCTVGAAQAKAVHERQQRQRPDRSGRRRWRREHRVHRHRRRQQPLHRHRHAAARQHNAVRLGAVVPHDTAIVWIDAQERTERLRRAAQPSGGTARAALDAVAARARQMRHTRHAIGVHHAHLARHKRRQRRHIVFEHGVVVIVVVVAVAIAIAKQQFCNDVARRTCATAARRRGILQRCHAQHARRRRAHDAAPLRSARKHAQRRRAAHKRVRIGGARARSELAPPLAPIGRHLVRLDVVQRQHAPGVAHDRFDAVHRVGVIVRAALRAGHAQPRAGQRRHIGLGAHKWRTAGGVAGGAQQRAKDRRRAPAHRLEQLVERARQPHRHAAAQHARRDALFADRPHHVGKHDVRVPVGVAIHHTRHQRAIAAKARAQRVLHEAHVLDHVAHRRVAVEIEREARKVRRTLVERQRRDAGALVARIAGHQLVKEPLALVGQQ